MGSELIRWLGVSSLAITAAILLVLLLRRPVRHWLGAGAAYALWACVPVTLLALLLPAPARETAAATAAVVAIRTVLVESSQGASAQASLPAVLGWIWIAGMLLMATLLSWQQRRFLGALGVLRRRNDGCWEAAGVAGLPAAIGLLRPRIVLPRDFEQRYEPAEQDLVLQHERTHIARGDLQANAVVALLCCLYWFNPLVHLAARRFRFDQELACDARVLRSRPRARSDYAQAMLKTQFDAVPLPVGCHWQLHHPLKERIAMLKRPTPKPNQWMVTAALVAGLGSTLGYGAWAAKPAGAAALASPATVAEAVYRVQLQVDVDGERQQFAFEAEAGKPFAFTMRTAQSHEWHGTFTARPVNADGVFIAGTLSVDGKQVAKPSMSATLAKPARLRIDQPAGGALQLEMLATPVDAVARAPGAAKPAHKAKPHSPISSTDGSKVDVEPVVEQMPPPRYPSGAFQQGISGKVVLHVEVGADGRAGGIDVVSAEPKGVFEENTVAAARNWTFKPAMKDGKPVASTLRIPVQFELDAPGE